MEMLGKVRRMHLRDKLSLHEISKRTGLVPQYAAKWLRKPETDLVAPPRYVRGSMPNQLMPFHATLEQALKTDAHASSRTAVHPKRCLSRSRPTATLAAIAASLISPANGAAGKAMPHVPSSRSVSSIGEVFQFDWSEKDWSWVASTDACRYRT